MYHSMNITINLNLHHADGTILISEDTPSHYFHTTHKHHATIDVTCKLQELYYKLVLPHYTIALSIARIEAILLMKYNISTVLLLTN